MGCRGYLVLLCLLHGCGGAEALDVQIDLEREDASVRVRLDICRDVMPQVECSDGGTLFEANQGELTRTVGIRVDEAFEGDAFRLIVHVEKDGDDAFTRCYETRVSLLSAPLTTTLTVDAEGMALMMTCVATGECDPLEVCT